MNRLLIVIVVACACSAPPKRFGVVNAETIRIADGAFYRVEPDGTVSVVVHVSFQDLSAPGLVRLRGVDLNAAPSSKHLRYARARAWQTISYLATDPAVAFDAAVNGYDELEATYSLRGLHDDSGQRVRLLQHHHATSLDGIEDSVARVQRILARQLLHYAEAWARQLR